jgi:hypothetical protein
MSLALVKTEKGEPTGALPYLSHSRVNRYLHCPEQYRLYYLECLRPKVPAAALVFGQMVHQALAHLFRTGDDPVGLFQTAWTGLRDVRLNYGKRGSWNNLATAGEQLLSMFVKEQLPRIEHVRAVEHPFTLTITNLHMPLVGVLDLVADVETKRTVVDFKTAASGYEAHTVALSDQLTAYRLAEPEADAVALCVLVKAAAPRIEWHHGKRQAGHLTEYLQKLEIVAHGITLRHFFKRPGWWCASCDYLPVCVVDRARARATLTVAPEPA